MKIQTVNFTQPSKTRSTESKLDPLAAMWESRRQEAQDVRDDWLTMQQKIQQSKERIYLSRLAFFWKVSGMHTGFLNETWRPKDPK